MPKNIESFSEFVQGTLGAEQMVSPAARLVVAHALLVGPDNYYGIINPKESGINRTLHSRIVRDMQERGLVDPEYKRPPQPNIPELTHALTGINDRLGDDIAMITSRDPSNVTNVALELFGAAIQNEIQPIDTPRVT